MAVYRVNKTKGFTVMANYHLQDITISLKAVGLLTKMLSFPDGWKFSTEGLAAICKEGPDAMLDAICSPSLTVRFNGTDIPKAAVRERFLQLDSEHIEYVITS